jgi:hypothetical protein
MAKNTSLKKVPDLREQLDKGFRKVRKKLIAETKAKNSYLVVADKNGKIKKIPAKDL